LASGSNVGDVQHDSTDLDRAFSGWEYDMRCGQVRLSLFDEIAAFQEHLDGDRLPCEPLRRCDLQRDDVPSYGSSLDEIGRIAGWANVLDFAAQLNDALAWRI